LTTEAVRQLRLEREWLFRRATRFEEGNPESMLAAFSCFCSNFVKIKRPGQAIPFDLRDSQRETARYIFGGRNVIILKSRQTGFSTLLANLTLWLCLVSDAYDVVFLSMNEREAVRLMGIAKFTYRRMPSWLKERLPVPLDNNQQKMSFSSDSAIESLPSQKDAARGRTVRLMVADEFASLADQEEAWASMLPATDIGGQVVLLSTAKGSGDLFETLWNKAKLGEMDFVPLFWSWREAFDDVWYEQKKATVLPWILAQEHPTNAEEAFIRAGNSVFNLDRLREMKPIPAVEGEIIYTKAKTGEFQVKAGGSLAVWDPPHHKTAYVMGVDTAEGLEHGDRSVAVVLSVPDGRMVARYIGRAAPWEFAQQVSELGWWYNTALVGPERNFHGHALIRSMVEWGYPKIYKHFRAQTRREQPTEVLGWLTTRASKAHIMSELDKFIVDNDIPDQVTIGEMMRYVRDDGGRMGGSPFDDCVMAFAIGVEMLSHAHEPQYQQKKQEPGPWTFGWAERWMEMLDGAGQRIGFRNVKG